MINTITSYIIIIGIQILILLFGAWLIEIAFFNKEKPKSSLNELQKKYFWAFGIGMLVVAFFLIAQTAIELGISSWILIIFFLYLGIRFLNTSYLSYKK